MHSSLRLIRPANVLMSCVGTSIGLLIAIEGHWSWLLHPNALKAVLIVALYTAAGNVLNDFTDREIDRIAHPERPIPSGNVEARTALCTAVVLFVVGQTLALTVNAAIFLIAFLNLGIMVLYETYTKNRGIVGNLSIAWLTASLFLFGAAAVGRTERIGVFLLLSFFATTGREIIKDIQDMEGDRGIRCTVPLTAGRKKALLIASIFLLLTVACSPLPFLLDIMGPAYLITVLIADTIFIYSIFLAEKNAARSQQFTKLGMAVALLSFVVGSLGG